MTVLRFARSAVLAALLGCEPAPPSPTPTPTPGPASQEQLECAGSPQVSCPEGEALVDCLPAVGLELPVGGQASGATLVDLNGDGLPEVIHAEVFLPPRLWLNCGGFGFEDVTDRVSGFPRVASAGIAAGDLDNDGLPDLFVTPSPIPGTPALGPPPIVLRNRGAEGFEDVTEPWGFGPFEPTEATPFRGADLFDLDGDGRLDVLPRSLLAGESGDLPRSWLWLSQPDGTWREAALEVLGEVRGFQYAAALWDADADGVDELFLVAMKGSLDQPARAFRRTSAWPPRFEEYRPVAELFGDGSAEHALMSAVRGDLDGDGADDLVITDIGDQHVLVAAAGGPVPSAATLGLIANPNRDGEAMVGFGASTADVDNDGRADLLLTAATDNGNPQDPWPVLLLAGDGGFEDRSDLIGGDGPLDSMGLASGDLDGDGRTDFWLAGQGELPRVLRNQLDVRPGLRVWLRGTVSNRDGIGARVAVLGAAPSTRAVQAGGNAFGFDPPSARLGLPEDGEALEVLWPSGFVQRVPGPIVPGDRVVEEPRWLTVSARSVAVGEPVQLELQLDAWPGAPQVTARLLPEGSGELTDGSGSFVPAAPGLHAFEILVDGVILPAHPSVAVTP